MKNRCRFLPVLCCNVLPNVTDTSHGAWRRLVSVQFPTLFKETPVHPNERPLDDRLDQKIQRWGDALLTYMLTGGYQRAETHGLHIPTSVTLTTSEYRTESDFYHDYFNERIVKTTVSTDRVTWVNMWVDFYHWFRRSHGHEHLPKKVEARKRFESEHFKQKLKTGEWTGFLLPSHCSAG